MKFQAELSDIKVISNVLRSITFKEVCIRFLNETFLITFYCNDKSMQLFTLWKRV